MKAISLIPLATLLLMTRSISAATSGHWDYTEMDFWGEMENSGACENGVRQSPIDINDKSLKDENPGSGYVTSGASSEVVTAQAKPCPGNKKCGTITNNGHTIQVNVNSDDYPITSTYRGNEFKLLQFHFHTPSEHHIRGDFSPLEVHFVHKLNDKSFMVIGIMFQFNGTVNSTFLDMVKSLVSVSFV